MAKKFNFNAALTDTAAAIGGGVAGSIIGPKVSDMLKLDGKIGAFVPVAIGFYLSQQKNRMLSAAGLGMIGSSANQVLDELNIDLGIGNPSSKQMLLNQGQVRKMLAETDKMKVAGPKVLNGALYDAMAV